MALLLKVPYGEKEEAKALGAKWNAELKKVVYFKQKRLSKISKMVCKSQC